MLGLAALLLVGIDVDTQHLSSVAEKEAREHVAAELQARAQSLALDAADAVALSAPLGQPTLESFLTRDSSLSLRSLQGHDEGSLFERQRPGPTPSDEVAGEATRQVRDLDAQAWVHIAQLMGRFSAPLAPFLRLLKRQADGTFPLLPPGAA